MKYFRIHSNIIAPKTQQPLGLYVLIWTLVNKEILSSTEVSEYWENRKWFEEHLPIPGFYDNGNSIKAITWFKNNDYGNTMFNRMEFYLRMAKKYDFQLFKSECINEPGEIIYEDEFQIGVINAEKFTSNIIVADFIHNDNY